MSLLSWRGQRSTLHPEHNEPDETCLLRRTAWHRLCEAARTNPWFPWRGRISNLHQQLTAFGKPVPFVIPSHKDAFTYKFMSECSHPWDSSTPVNRCAILSVSAERAPFMPRGYALRKAHVGCNRIGSISDCRAPGCQDALTESEPFTEVPVQKNKIGTHEQDVASERSRRSDAASAAHVSSIRDSMRPTAPDPCQNDDKGMC